MADEAASSILVDEATAINTNAVQQLTVSDHPRARRNSAGDDGIHYYENHDSLLMDKRFVQCLHVRGRRKAEQCVYWNYCMLLSSNPTLPATPPMATATPPPTPAAPTYENQSSLVTVSDVISHSTASESHSYVSSANHSPLITAQWPARNGHWPRPQVPPKPKKSDAGAIYQARLLHYISSSRI